MQLGFSRELQKFVLFKFDLREGMVIFDSDSDMNTLTRRNGMPDASDDNDSDDNDAIEGDDNA